MAKKALGWVLMLLTVSLVGCDHATKLAAQAALGSGRSVSIVPGVVDLRYAENRDSAFSLLRVLHLQSAAPLLVFAASAALLAAAFVWWQRRHAGRLEQTGYALVVAGAIGNVADRIARGYVIDFIHVRHWPIFNVADIAIAVGGAILAWSMLRQTPTLDRGSRTP